MSWCEPLEPRRLLAAAAVDTLVAAGAAWRYLDTGAQPAAAWTAPTFDDSTWKSGAAQLGYGDGDEATRISFGPSSTNKFITTYFRRSFPATEIRRYAALNIELKRDDGAVVYLNGREVARSNMPAGAVSAATLAPLNVAGADETAYYPYALPLAALAEGTNTLAVEIHQAAPSSADVSFDLRLTATQNAPDPTPFTVVVLPDTQFYAQSYPATFDAQTQWILDHMGSNNIRFVTHVGDIVQNAASGPDRNLVEWTRADAALDRLDRVVPYSVALGNHDYDVKDLHSGGATRYVESFGAGRYANTTWYGGASPDQHNHYQLFSAGGRTFLHINVEFEAPDSALAWAQSVIDAHPGMPVIMATHAYVQGTSGRSTTVRNPDGNSGEQMWQKLVRKNPQVFLFVNGHFPGEARQTSTDDAGLPVFEMLSDYQSRTNGGDGWMRLLEFHPEANRIDVKTWSPTLSRFETDANSQFTLPIDFNQRFNFTAPQPPPPPPPPPMQQTLTFQQGTNNYTFAADTLLRQAPDATGGPDSNLAAATTLHIDDESGGPGAKSEALLRFDKLFSNALGPIPLGSTIAGATLTVQITGPGSGMRLHRMLANWSDTNTWNTLTNGISPDDTEAAATPDATVGQGTAAANIPTGVLTLDVTASLRAWSAGAINRGWALLPLPGGTDGLSFSSSEATTLTQRPKLTVTFVPPATIQLQAEAPPPRTARQKLSQRQSIATALLDSGD
jgi:hypothetical protein